MQPTFGKRVAWVLLACGLLLQTRPASAQDNAPGSASVGGSGASGSQAPGSSSVSGSGAPGSAIVVAQPTPGYVPGSTLFGPSPAAGYVVMQDSAGVYVPSNLYQLQGVAGKGPGWDEDYVRFGSMLPYNLVTGRSLLFASLNGGMLATGDSFGNFGFGYQQYDPEWQWLGMISGWYDLDGGQARNYSRGGFSLSSQWHSAQFRLNTYHVFDRGTTQIGEALGTPRFLDHHIVSGRVRQWESVYDGGDFEVGGPLPLVGHLGVSGFVGGYWLNTDGAAVAENEDAFGFRLRGQIDVNEDTSIGLTHSQDDIFGSTTFFNVSMTLSGRGVHQNWFQKKPTASSLGGPVLRENRIQAKRYQTTDEEVFINPADAEPFYVLHIDPNATTDGDGSFEHPFRSVASFANSAGTDIVFVNAGNTANLVGNIALLDGQRLLSSGVQHSFTSTIGTYALPGYNPAAGLPIMTNPVGPIVTLANGNEVSGFDFNGALLTDGVAGNGIVDFNINRNVFRGLDNGVALADASGTGWVDLNTFTGNMTGFSLINGDGSTLDLDFRRNTAAANGTGAYVEANGGSTINAVVTRNSFDDNTDVFTGFRARSTGTGSTVDVDFAFNTFAGNVGNGLALEAFDDGVMTASVTDNIFDSNGAAGFAVQTIDGTFTLDTFRRNTFTRNQNGFSLLARNASSIPLVAMDLNLFGSETDAGFRNVGNDVTFDIRDTTFVDSVVIKNNVFANTGVHGVSFLRSGDSEYTDVRIGGVLGSGIDGNRFVNVGQNAVNLNLGGGGLASGDVQTFAINENTILDPGANGIYANPFADTVLDGTIDSNLIERAGANGIRVEAAGFATYIGTISNNTIGSAAVDGIWLSGAFDPTARVEDNLVQGSGANGIRVDGARGVLNVDRNLVTDSGNVGLLIESSSALGFDLIGSDNVIRRSTGTGVEISASDDATLTVDLTRTTVRDGAADGVKITNDGGFNFVDATLTDSKIFRNAGNGIYVLNTGESDMRVEIAGTTDPLVTQSSLIANNGGDGILVENDAGREDTENNLAFVLTDTAVISNSGHGLNLRVGTSRRGIVQALVDGNSFSGNTGVDVFIESFVSVLSDDFDDETYETTDPLARLELQFRNNTGDEIQVTNFGAFYDNDDANKSPDPPFVNADRRRNAQRENGTYNAVPGLPGVGDSTFVVENDALISNNFALIVTGFLDEEPLSSTFPIPNPDEDDFPFNWLTVAPGTFVDP